MTAAQTADLKQLIAAQLDKSSPYYHKWLSPEQFAARFGANQNDIDRITAWLNALGFADVQVARSRTFISMTGTAAQVRYAFQTPIHQYAFKGRTHYANASDPILPQALQGVVSAIRGLNDFHPHPLATPRVVQPRFTSGITGEHFLAPEDFQIIYNVAPLLQSGIDGTGQSIAITGQTDIQLSDIEAFQKAAGLPVKDPTIVVDGPDPGTKQDNLSEADLDIEWSGAVAPGAKIIYVNSSDAFTSLIYAIDNKLAPVVSISYGNCEANVGTADINALNQIFMMANSQGQTVVAPAGDSGAADCDSNTSTASHGLAVDFPASSPFVTGAGGSEFNEGSGTYWSTTNDAKNGSALSYIPEMAWNDTAATGTLSAGGGGASTICGTNCGKPSWQQGTGVPNDNSRDVPDIVLNASPNHDGYLVCTGGSCVNGFRASDQTLTVYGGTSCTTPTFAGIVALVDQATGQSQGNVNPVLYSLASVSSDAFHDIAVGNNQVPCKAGTPDCTTGTLGYVAGTGYDQVTGLGSVNAYNLVNEWNAGFTITVTPTTLDIASGGNGSATVQVNSVSDFSHPVSLSCTVASSLTGTTCSVPASVNGSGSVTLTVTNSGSKAVGVTWRNLPTYALPSGILLAGFSLLFFKRKQVRLAGFSIGVGLLLVACGGGNSSNSATPTSSVQPTPAAITGDVTVTATSGSITHTATVSVTIQ
jgi:subtilase family serine protease